LFLIIAPIISKKWRKIKGFGVRGWLGDALALTLTLSLKGEGIDYGGA